MSTSLEIYDLALKYVAETAKDRSGTQEGFIALALGQGYLLEDVQRVGAVVLLELVDRLVIKEPAFDQLLGAVYDATDEQREKIAREVRGVLLNGAFLTETKRAELDQIREVRTSNQSSIAAAEAAREAIAKSNPEALVALDAGIRTLRGTDAAFERAEQEALGQVESSERTEAIRLEAQLARVRR